MLLLEQGADVNAVAVMGYNGLCPLQLAAKYAEETALSAAIGN